MKLNRIKDKIDFFKLKGKSLNDVFQEREEAKRIKEGDIGVQAFGIGMPAIPTSVSSTSVSSTITIQDNLM